MLFHNSWQSLVTDPTESNDANIPLDVVISILEVLISKVQSTAYAIQLLIIK